jgi:L-iditol 2-dehydrogenase
VIVIGRSRGRLARATALGADAVWSILDGDALNAVREFTAGRGADVVLESAGSSETWQQAFDMTRPGGTAVMFSGLPGGTTVHFDATKLHYSQITVKGIFHHTPRYVEMALNLLATGQIDATRLIDGEIGLDTVEEGLLRMDRSEAIKLIVRP